ncbi:MAG: adenylyltransferase/cytidyltransferase family protein [Burkholderiaceae bacterium]
MSDDVPALPRPSFEGKICPPEALASHLPALKRPLVFTNGVFDLLHRGHVTYLAQARALGTSLILALNTDDSVRRLNKGPERPLNALADRLAVVAALDSTTLVTWFDQDTPAELIELTQPDILVKGGDWATADIVGGDQVRARGGKVFSIPFEHQRSTTGLVEKIRRQIRSE